ncbi:LysR family transcriptional regulator [Aliiroseovarius sp. PTFE2010]|uniref:LysR family transcriptional regulator n=1 Tax=Aliiroseovarius sp. PTFE2010 TaxID=3417190 RepID=UPI003CED25A3
MDNWDEIRTAYHVARRGTVSGAAEVLGVHHATVIRHIDSLEARLGVKLFQRHARGYTATEAGSDLLSVAQATDDQFSQLASRIRGRGEAVSGELTVTAVPGMSGLLLPALAGFQRTHPDVRIKYLSDPRVLRLEYGEAHVAIRAGAIPQEPDNVVQPFYKQDIALYANADYVATHGIPKTEDELLTHLFIGTAYTASRAPFHRWLNANVSEDNIVFRTSGLDAGYHAIMQGMGIGFMPVWVARGREDLIEVAPPRDEWASQSWLVTHVDLHRSPKVQTFLSYLKDNAKSWPRAAD